MDQTELQKLKIPSSEEGGDGKSVTVEVAEEKKEMEWNDLCLTCNNVSVCTSRKGFKRPVYFCEEFDDFVPSPKISSPSEPKSISRSEEKDTSKYPGLCMNCAHCETCTFPKPEGGIWHCEEYE